MDTHLTLSSWNMKGFAGANPYLNDLLASSDICVILEHHLPDNHLHKLDELNVHFDKFARSNKSLTDSSSSDKKGYGGIAIMWNKGYSHCIEPMKTMGNDRIIVIELSPCGKQKIYIIAVYLPQRRCYIDSFNACVEVLHETIVKCQQKGEVIIIGDYNCHYGPEYGSRCWGKTTTNATLLNKILQACKCQIMDVDGDICSGPCYSFHVDGVGTSYIDHCAASFELMKNITSIEVLSDDIHNSSDHLAIQMRLNCMIRSVDKQYHLRTVSRSEKVLL